MEIPDKIFFKIGEVSEIAGVKPYVLRYWESEFSINPHKSGSGQRLYRKKDIERILLIKRLLYQEGFTIAGARKHLSRLGKGGSGDEESEGVSDEAGEQVPEEITTELPRELSRSIPFGGTQGVSQVVSTPYSSRVYAGVSEALNTSTELESVQLSMPISQLWVHAVRSHVEALEELIAEARALQSLVAPIT